ncbi:MAG: carbon starvation CstA family protein [Polyangiaceae bacterium]
MSFAVARVDRRQRTGRLERRRRVSFSNTNMTLAIAAYGFASVLPVWLLLCPRDYLSSYLKLGTIGSLVGGIVIVNPPIQMPGVTKFIPRRWRPSSKGAALSLRVHHHRLRRD